MGDEARALVLRDDGRRKLREGAYEAAARDFEEALKLL
jgi:hypothetical protein